MNEEAEFLEFPDGDFDDEDTNDETTQEYIERIEKEAAGQIKMTVNKNIDDSPDSISIGTDGKGGCIKCYGDAKDLDSFKKKFDNMVELRIHANKKMNELVQ